ncbi:MAG: hypothetical protein PHD97_00785 [Bacteroidales bacterium]|nr:hypothetical protein [Bacteroidales bacterium]
MKNTTQTKENIEAQKDVFDVLPDYARGVFSEEGAQGFLSPFGLNAKDYIRRYECDPTVRKPLRGYNNEKYIFGLAASEIPGIIARHLKLDLKSDYAGKCTQINAEIDELKAYLGF